MGVGEIVIGGVGVGPAVGCGPLLPPLFVPEPDAPCALECEVPDAFGPGDPVGVWVWPVAVSTGGCVTMTGAGVALGRTPGTAIPSAVVPVAIAAAPQFMPRRWIHASSESCATHEPRPTTRQSRPIEMLRKARTTIGSNCEPEHLTSSWRAAETPRDFRYGRAAVITS